jgi:hypothetical protein
MLLTVFLGAVTAALVAMLVRDALSGPPRPFAWGMFTQVAFGEFHLVTANGDRLDPFRYIPNQSVRFDAMRLEDFLTFLDEEHNIRPSGHVLLANGETCWRVEIADGDVVRVTNGDANMNRGTVHG